MGPSPEGWGHLVDDIMDFEGPPPEVKPLFRLKRGELLSLSFSKEKQLELLLKEQEQLLLQVKQNPGPDFLVVNVRSNNHE